MSNEEGAYRPSSEEAHEEDDEESIPESEFVDCHCHITDAVFDEDRMDVVEQARRQSDVSHILAVASGVEDIEKVVNLSRDSAYKNVILPCLGMHPEQHEIRSVTGLKESQPMLDAIRRYADEIVGIGEVGLDFTPRCVTSWRDSEEPTDPYIREHGFPDDKSEHAVKQAQREVFAAQIELAKELHLPLNVHSRSAGHYAIDMLLEHGAPPSLLHAFDGKAKYAKNAAEKGHFFSIPPSIVRSGQKEKLLQALPLSQIVLETDSPALGPNKNERNVPSNVLISAREIARVKDVPLDHVVQTVFQNTLRLFPRISRYR
eukprot:gb/GECG01005593.1/.p1 GENE.gb/GECG01005593.1/~~gb/GECG01005593.1/.p1  ORF type:complete len:317 (+),score=44.78 gb/GECG01005593.1/:1-951(+)